jgi:alkylmercury lyase
MRTNPPDIPAQAAEFTAAHPELDDSQQRLALALFRLLAGGEPVTPQELSERSRVPVEAVVSEFNDWAMVHRDEQGRVRAFGGLSLEPTSHVLEVGGRTLYAWCALDTLFLPELLGRPARIRSTCPETGEEISLTVDAAGARDAVPQAAVMSLHDAEGMDLAHVIETFCCYVHFFANVEAARAWTARSEGTYVVPIAEGLEYGRLYKRGRFGAALEAGDA